MVGIVEHAYNNPKNVQFDSRGLPYFTRRGEWVNRFLFDALGKRIDRASSQYSLLNLGKLLQQTSTADIPEPAKK